MSNEPAWVGKAVIFVDGTCVFCNRLVSFILDRDQKGRFFFAHIQSPFARAAIARHRHDPDDLDSIYALADAGTPRERLLIDGEAGRVIWPSLFPVLGFLRWVPLWLLDLNYRLFARVRFRLFGRYDACRVPSESERARCVE